MGMTMYFLIWVTNLTLTMIPLALYLSPLPLCQFLFTSVWRCLSPSQSVGIVVEAAVVVVANSVGAEDAPLQDGLCNSCVPSLCGCACCCRGRCCGDSNSILLLASEDESVRCCEDVPRRPEDDARVAHTSNERRVVVYVVSASGWVPSLLWWCLGLWRLLPPFSLRRPPFLHVSRDSLLVARLLLLLLLLCLWRLPLWSYLRFVSWAPTHDYRHCCMHSQPSEQVHPVWGMALLPW